MTHIFLLAGAPAVGKSTTAHALAAQFQKSIHIPVDDVRSMVVSGLVHPGADWGQDLIEQLALARENVTRMASAYIAAGIRTVYEHLNAAVTSLERQGWLVVDTTDKSVEATVRHIPDPDWITTVTVNPTF